MILVESPSSIRQLRRRTDHQSLSSYKCESALPHDEHDMIELGISKLTFPIRRQLRRVRQSTREPRLRAKC